MGLRAWLSKRNPRLLKYGECHARAAGEVVVVNIFSLVPLAALPLGAIRATSSLDFNLFWRAIGAGQLYLYGFALFGTLMWLCIKENGRASEARSLFKKVSLIVTIVPAFFMMMLFVINPEMTHPLSDGLVKTSIAFYVGYVIIYYFLLVLNDLPAPSVSEQIGEGVNTLERELVESRR